MGMDGLRTLSKNVYKCYVNMESKKISFKRLSTASKESIASADKGTQTCNKCHIPSHTECYRYFAKDGSPRRFCFTI